MTDRTGSLTGLLLAGRYRLVSPLAAGGMGTVWRAHDDLLDRPVAVKELALPPELDDREQDTMRARTMREARAAARLRHPSIITIYDVVEQGGRPWIVMELVASRSLAGVLAEPRLLSVREAAGIGLHVLGALTAAHAAGILHRDVKPGNVLLADDGRVVLTDFGIATLVGDVTLTRTGQLIGSPAYIAPERARGARPGPAADLWSLGAMLYAAVEGQPPFQRDGALQTVTATIMDETPEPRHAGPLRDVIVGLLIKDPARRLTAAGARSMLQRAVAGPARPVRRLPPVPPARPAPPAPRAPLADPGPGAMAMPGPAAGSAVDSGKAVAGPAGEAAGAPAADPRPGASGAPPDAGPATVAVPTGGPADETATGADPDGAAAGPDVDGEPTGAGRDGAAPGSIAGTASEAASEAAGGAEPGAAGSPAGAGRDDVVGGPPGRGADRVGVVAGSVVDGASGAAAELTSAGVVADHADASPHGSGESTVDGGVAEPPAADARRAAGAVPARPGPAEPGRSDVGGPAAVSALSEVLTPRSQTPPRTPPAPPAAPPRAPAGPARAPRTGRRWPVWSGAAAVLVAVVAALVAWAVSGDGGATGDQAASGGSSAGRPPPTSAASRAPSPSGSAPATRATTSAAATPARTTTGSTPGIPAGFVDYHDPTGFSVAIPAGWQRVRHDPRVDFEDPDSGRFLRIDQTTHPAGDPYQDWLRQEGPVSRKLAGYHRISIKRVDYRGWSAADWEFTTADAHVLSRNIVPSAHRAYALYWSTPVSQWSTSDSTEVFAVAARTFTPAGD
ncbi:MAG: eukaryotic-like serine/threonine-protein kinase [Mycobacteriales bacterium]